MEVGRRVSAAFISASASCSDLIAIRWGDGAGAGDGGIAGVSSSALRTVALFQEYSALLFGLA